MDENKNIYVGLDIGTTKIACIVGRVTSERKNKVEIIGFGRVESKGVSRGLVINIDETVESIKGAVKIAQEQLGDEYKISNVTVGIAGQHITSNQHHGMCMRDDPTTEITAEEVERLRKETYKIEVQPGEEIIDVIAQESYVDGELCTNPKGMCGHKLEVNYHVIIARAQSVRNIKRCIERAGLKLDYLILEPIASADAVLVDEELEAGVALIDIGGGTTDLAIFHENRLYHTAIIPMGGELITKDIMTGCRIIRKYAETVKVKYGSALESKNRADEIVSIPGIKGHAKKEISFTMLSGIIEARLSEIFTAVNAHIQRIHNERPLNGGIVLTGGGSQMKDITDLLKYITGMDVRIGLPNEHTENNDLMQNISNPMYSTGIGLILESIARDEIINRNKKKETKVETPAFNGTVFNPAPETPVQKPEEESVVVVVEDNDNIPDTDVDDDDERAARPGLFDGLRNAAKKWFDSITKEVDD